VLHFAGVDLSVGVVLIDSLEVFLCGYCRGWYTSQLLETPTMSLPIKDRLHKVSLSKEKHLLVLVGRGLRSAQKGVGVGKDKVEGVHYEAVPVVIHLISLELATERV